LKRPLVALLAVAFLVIGAPSARAHGVFVFPYTENGELVAEGYFADGGPPVDAAVRITAPDGAEIASGRTDDAGLFKCPIPDADEVEVELHAGPGHVARATITLDGAIATTSAEPPHATRAARLIAGLLAIGGVFGGAMAFANRKRRGKRPEPAGRRSDV